MRLTWPLTGRSEEMRAIAAAIAAAEPSGILIRGAAGIGKSRIAREALSAAEANGRDVRWAVASSSARALPLGAFMQWAAAADTDNPRLEHRVIEALTSTTTDEVAVVGIDDVHLLDDLSAIALHQIVARRAAKVVLTLRDGETIPLAVREIWNAGQFERLDLQPLSQDETTSLVATTLNGPLEPDTAQRLWKLTRGNALYLRNIVGQEVGDRRLTRKHGYWEWTGDPVVPPDLVEMIESRFGTLPAAVGDVIDTVAVGEPIALTSLNRITDPAAVEEADMRGLITTEHVDGDVEVRIAHPLYSEVRRRRTPPTRLRRLRGLVAAELAARPTGNDMRMVVRRATLMLDSDVVPDPDLLVSAAGGAVWLGDLPLADRLADAAIRAGGGSEANFVRAHVLGWLNRGEEADAALLACPTDGFTDADHARLAFLRANSVLWNRGDPKGAKQLIDEAALVIPEHSRDCLDAFLTIYWSVLGVADKARDAAKNLALDRLPGIVCAETAPALVGLHGHAGRTAQAVAAADPGYAIIAARPFVTPHMRFVLAHNHVAALLYAGQISEAQDVADRLCEQSADLPGRARFLSEAVAGRAALGAGHLDTACNRLQPVAELTSVSTEPSDIGYIYRLPYTTALAIRGLIDQAAAALATAEKIRRPSRRYLDGERAIAHAWVSVAHGAVSEAVRTLTAAADIARVNGRFAEEVMCLQVAIQFGDSSGVSRLRELEAVVEGPRVGVVARFAAALSDGDGLELTGVSERFEGMGDLVAAADAAAHAAVVYRRAGQKGSALTCSARAEELALRCGGLSTPALRKAYERVPLSGREREVAMLISSGMSGNGIAKRLSLSVRTVEGHIYRAMAKTGAKNRDELGRMVPRSSRNP